MRLLATDDPNDILGIIQELEDSQKQLRKDVMNTCVRSSRIGFQLSVHECYGMTFEDRNFLVKAINDEMSARNR